LQELIQHLVQAVMTIGKTMFTSNTYVFSVLQNTEQARSKTKSMK